MNRSNPKNLVDLETFVQVVDSGGFSAAARVLNLSASTVSKQVKRLEAALGTDLFTRSTRHIYVTEKGRQIYVSVRLALSQLDEAYAVAEAGQVQMSGPIAISSPSVFNQAFLIGAMQAFKTLHPQVSFYLNNSSRLVDMYADGIDIAIRIGHLSDSQLVLRKIFDAHRVLVCAPNYVDAASGRRAPVSLEELQALQALMFAYPGHDSGQWALELDGGEGGTQVVSMSKAMGADDGHILLQWALAGHGVALLEPWVVADDLAAGRLQRLLPNWIGPARPVQVVRTQKHAVLGRVAQFTEFLVDYCRARHSQIYDYSSQVL
ncbi:MAG: LysR family transcriptional regulator [Neisseriaceae bacterium]|nr:LysR family transcriptional regulator [Neisseriaceae bacterium]